MDLDLNSILQDWPHEPGQIKVRKIVAKDGSEKLQLRIDLGVIQMEVQGRPDGERPHGCESLLEYHLERAREKESLGENYMLSAEDCAELQHEGIQYYHRYISLFQLNDFHGVIRDTQRNLELLGFVSDHCENQEAAAALEQFRPYILMMNTRARAAIEIERDDYAAAVRQIERGRERIAKVYKDCGEPDMAAKSPEIAFLNEWLEEVSSKRPATKLEKMQREMERAIAVEAYERAAELRDAIKAYGKKKRSR